MLILFAIIAASVSTNIYILRGIAQTIDGMNRRNAFRASRGAALDQYARELRAINRRFAARRNANAYR